MTQYSAPPETTNPTIQRITAFVERFGQTHLYLAYHAALPLALTPDLLYRIWATFPQDIHGTSLNISWIAVADLLLSNLCEEVGHELFELNRDVRAELLKQLQQDSQFGQVRIQELSDFLLTYVRSHLDSPDLDRRDFAQAQTWVVLAHTQPETAAREIASTLAGLEIANRPEWLRLTSLVETLKDPLSEHQPLLIYAQSLQQFTKGEIELASRSIHKVLDKNNQVQVAGVTLPIPETLTQALKRERQNRSNSIRVGILWSTVATALVLGFRFLGLLQPLELNSFDQLLRLRPNESIDPRFLIVEITENDIQTETELKEKGISLSDASLERLLKKLEPYQPSLIGLNLYRNFGSSRPSLVTRLRKNARFIGICKLPSFEGEKVIDGTDIAPPLEVPLSQVGFSDILYDPDYVTRRQVIRALSPANAPCQATQFFGFLIAHRYLEQVQRNQLVYKDPVMSNDLLQLGEVIFQRLEAFSGGYQGIDDSGFQILLNYRTLNSDPGQSFDRISLGDLLNDRVPSAKLTEWKNRIVLVGATTYQDEGVRTPYGQIPTVLYQAQIASQIISAVLDGRSLLMWWNPLVDATWILGWSLVGGLFALRLRTILHLGLAGWVSLGTLGGLCYSFLVIASCWVPLAPAALSLVLTVGLVKLYTRFQYTRFQFRRIHSLDKVIGLLGIVVLLTFGFVVIINGLDRTNQPSTLRRSGAASR